MNVKSKIDEWVISLNKTNCEIWVRHSSKKRPNSGSWEIPTKVFKKQGMRKFPKELYKLICTELKYANIYDRFLDKFYDWDESDE